MPSLCLLWLVLLLLVPVGHAVPLQRNSPEIFQRLVLTADVLVAVGQAVPLQESVSEIVQETGPPCKNKPDHPVPVVTLYHYTDKAGYDGISKQGYINPAQHPAKNCNDDSRFGQGVYFTALGPDHSDEELAKNNWNGTAGTCGNKLKYYFECKITREKMCHSTRAIDEKRDIWVFSGGKFYIHKTGTCSGRPRNQNNPRDLVFVVIEK